MSLDSNLMARVSLALRKHFSAASRNLGTDCMLFAMHAQRLLSTLGIETRLVVGEAAWHFGPQKTDGIAHSPRLTGLKIVNGNSFAFHAWLEREDHILDFSTFTFRTKAALMDAQDGGSTQVNWCPDYLMLAYTETRDLETLINESVEGTACYREIPRLLEYLHHLGHKPDIDASDAALLLMIYNRPNVAVIDAMNVPSTSAAS